MSALPPFELGYPRTKLRRQLVDATPRGEKTATVEHDWPVAHEHFFGRPIESETEFVAIRFRVVEGL